MRRETLRVIGLRECRVRHEHQLCALQRLLNFFIDPYRDAALPIGVLYFQRRLQSSGVPAPHGDVVTLLRQIRGGGVSAVSASDDGDLHSSIPIQPLCEMSNTTPFGSRNLRSKSTPPPPFSSRWKRPPFCLTRSV